MLKLYEKSHIKHLPGYGRVWYGFLFECIKDLMKLRPEFFVGFDHVIQDLFGNQKAGDSFERVNAINAFS